MIFFELRENGILLKKATAFGRFIIQAYNSMIQGFIAGWKYV
ncbi:MAG: hypothetical protein H6Q19_1938 [Bacteroidetes bacterium]|nr:hypothetical protein [Bacteroidota bacterium]